MKWPYPDHLYDDGKKCQEHPNTRIFKNCYKIVQGCVRCYTKQWRQNTGALRRQNLKSKYNLTIEDFKSLLDKQNNACAICKEAFQAEICVDHCHISNRIRGLLCRWCNLGLGNFRDSTERLQTAIDYLTS